MVKQLVWNTPGVRQAIWLSESEPLEVATSDPSFTPAEAADHLEALRAIGGALPLGELVVGAFADSEVTATFHQKPNGVVVLVSDPELDTLAAYALALHEIATEAK